MSDIPKASPASQTAALAIVAVNVAFLAADFYSHVTRGICLRTEWLDKWFVRYGAVSIPVALAIIFGGLFYAAVQLARGRTAQISPFWIGAAVVSLALFGWAHSNDI